MRNPFVLTYLISAVIVALFTIIEVVRLKVVTDLTFKEVLSEFAWKSVAVAFIIAPFTALGIVFHVLTLTEDLRDDYVTLLQSVFDRVEG
jgi:hypothetical protein